MNDFQAYAIVAFVANVRNGMDVAKAKSEAVYLATVVDSKMVRGWSGTRILGRGPQVIPTKVRMKNGVAIVTKTFAGKPMSDSHFDKVVRDQVSEYNEAVRFVDRELKVGKNPRLVKQDLMARLIGV